MPRFQLLSLRWRLLLLIALAIGPLVAMAVVLGIQEREHALTTAQQNLKRLANLAAANEAQSIEQAMQILRDLSSVKALFETKDKCVELLEDILAKNKDFVNFGVIELNGDVSCSAVQSSTVVNLSDRPHFRRAVSERRFVAGNYVFGRVVQKHTVNLTYPVIKEGKVTAVLFAALDLSELDKFVTDIDLPENSVLWTLDENDTVISRRPDPAQWFGKRLPGAKELVAASRRERTVHVDTDGVKRLYASAGVGASTLTNYTVLIGVPEESILADSRHDQKIALVGLLLTICLAAVAAWWGGEILIVRRVRRLATTANSIASGELSTRSGVNYGKEEISDLAKALDQMAASLEAKDIARDAAEALLVAADCRKDEFLAMLAHELRNPLAPISAGAQILLETQKSNAQVTRTATVIFRQAAHMTSLVNDLLDVSRVTRGLVQLDKAVVDMRDIVNDAVEQLAPLMRQKKQQLTSVLPPEDCCVIGDENRLVQIVANLLNNAAKYTHEGGHIVAKLTVEIERIVLHVSDDGIGMTPQLVPRVFDLFSQAERTSDRSQGGLGIGLAIVNTLVNLHGGTVHAESQGLNMGSTFCVSLPRSKATRERVPRAETVKTKSRRNCLVVEDNVDVAQILANYLEAVGHTVRVAHDGTQALALALDDPPDVCLLDIGLPGLNGFQLVAKLRRQRGTECALMVAITGYGRGEDREQAFAAGFDHYFVKPIDTTALAEVLAALND